MNDIRSSKKDSPVKIGEKIRHLRRANHLRIRDVAERINCTESLISKIENDKTRPSFEVLRELANLLGASLDYLFSSQMLEVDPIGRLGERPVVQYSSVPGWSTGITKERLIPYKEEHLLQANIHIIEPGGKLTDNIEHPGEECGYVLEGTLSLFLEDELFTLSKGDSFYFRSERKHRYQNSGKSICKVIWVNTPPSFFTLPEQYG